MDSCDCHILGPRFSVSFVLNKEGQRRSSRYMKPSLAFAIQGTEGRSHCLLLLGPSETPHHTTPPPALTYSALEAPFYSLYFLSLPVKSARQSPKTLSIAQIKRQGKTKQNEKTNIIPHNSPRTIQGRVSCRCEGVNITYCSHTLCMVSENHGGNTSIQVRVTSGAQPSPHRRGRGWEARGPATSNRGLKSRQLCVFQPGGCERLYFV